MNILGGSTLYIETAKRKNASKSSKSEKLDGTLHLTGHLGDVMKESAQIALTVSRNFIKTIDENNTFLEARYLFRNIFNCLYMPFTSLFHNTAICIYTYQKEQQKKMVPALV